MTITVTRKTLDELKAAADGELCYGLFMPLQLAIWVVDDPQVPAQVAEQTFFHELLHLYYHLLDLPKLGSNEKHVDALGHLLHQFTVTAK